MKVKSTKSALLMSFTSLLLCFAMLIGTTFAWFTDSVTSGVNKIQAGTLKVDLVDEEGHSVKKGDLTSLQFKKAANHENETVLWEPGCTYKLPAVQVVNEGTLALKYSIVVTGVNGTAKLLEAIEFSANDTLIGTNGVIATGTLMPQGQTGDKSAPIVIKGHMKEEAGNEYQGLTLEGIAVTVYATQVEHEFDSISDQYDKDAAGMQPQGTPVASVGEVKVQKGEDGKVVTRDGETQTLTNGDMVVSLPAGVELAGDLAGTPNYDKDENDKELNTGKTNVQQGFVFVDDNGSDFLPANSVQANESVAYFDLKLPVAQTNTTLLKVEKQYIKGATVKDVYHNGIAMNKATNANTPGTVSHDEAGNNGAYWYDSASGKMTLWVYHASDVDVIYEIPAAKIGDTYYDTLAAAFAAVADGQTITLLKNSAGDGIMTSGTAKTVTIDFKGFTYTMDGETVGSAGTETQAIHFDKGWTVTLKNGTLTSAKAKLLIQNYCNLTLSDMTIEASGSGLLGAVSNNCGKVDIIGKTSITVPSNKFAVDAMYWPDGGYPEGTQVTINTTGTIDGMMSIGNNRQPTMGPTKLSIVAGNFVNYGVDTYGSATDLQSAYTITGGTFSSDPSKYVKAPYEAKQTGNVWTIEKYAAQISDTKYVTLEEALNAAEDGDTVTLLTDVSKTNANGNVFTISKSITLDGNNKTITITGNGASRGIQLKANGGNKTATIKNLTIETTGVGKTIGFDKEGTEYTFGGTLDNVIVNAQGVGVHTKGYANVEIKNCTINITTAAEYTAHNRSGVSAGPGATTTISNTNVTVTTPDKKNDNTDTWGKAIYVGYNEVQNGGKVVINSGKIKGDFALAIDGTVGGYILPTVSSNTIVVNDGTFDGHFGSPSGYQFKQIEVYGGTFTNYGISGQGFTSAAQLQSNTMYARLSITGGSFDEQPAKSYIANGYTATKSSGVWTVSKQPTNP